MGLVSSNHATAHAPPTCPCTAPAHAPAHENGSSFYDFFLVGVSRLYCITKVKQYKNEADICTSSSTIKVFVGHVTILA